VTARLSSLSTRAQIAVVVAVLVLVAIIGYFALIAPKHATAASLKKQTAAVEAQITANRSTAFTQALPAVRSATIFGLTQAMPSDLDTPDVILTLNSLAQDSGISFDQIQPGAADASAAAGTTVTADPFAAEPIQVKFNGSFYNMLAFLQRLRNLVRVQDGKLFTAGRLFDVTSLSFTEGTRGWPQVQAMLTIDAFVPQAPQAAVVPSATDTTTNTTATTTTGTTTTTPAPTSAAPSTSGGTS
jgi:Tfp pilus assembly protein PilO